MGSPFFVSLSIVSLKSITFAANSIFIMKHFIFSVLVLSSLFFSSCSSTNTSSNQENERLDKLKISTTNDKVAYSIGYTSAGELVEFVNSPQYGKYFSAVSINDGFFQANGPK